MKALIADDHVLFRSGLRHLLSQVFEPAEVAEAASLEEALELLAQAGPFDLLVFDLHMPGVDSVDTIAALSDRADGAKIVIMSACEGRQEVGDALAAGIQGYIPKSLEFSEIAAALNEVMGGNVFVPLSVTRREIAAARASSAKQPHSAALTHLTERQRNVLDELMLGKSSKEIARALDLAEGTVKVHLAAIYRLLGVKSRAEAIAKVRDMGHAAPARYRG